MALRINVENVKNSHDLYVRLEGGNQQLDVVTAQLAEAMWHGHIGSITGSNAGEVFRRVQVVEKINGPYMYSGPDPVFFTMEDVQRRVGMGLNVKTIGNRAFDQKARESLEDQK